MELHGQCSICFLWHVQKEAVHNVLRCDLLFYLMTLTCVFKSDLLTAQTANLKLTGSSALLALRDLTG